MSMTTVLIDSINNWFMVRVGPWSFGSTREVVQREGSESLQLLEFLATSHPLIDRCIKSDEKRIIAVDSNWSSYYSQVKITDDDGSRRCISSHNFEFYRISRKQRYRLEGDTLAYLEHDCPVSRKKCAELNGKRGSKESSKNL